MTPRKTSRIQATWKSPNHLELANRDRHPADDDPLATATFLIMGALALAAIAFLFEYGQSERAALLEAVPMEAAAVSKVLDDCHHSGLPLATFTVRTQDYATVKVECR